MSAVTAPRLDPIARRNARLAVVQALYQMEVSGATQDGVSEELRAGRLPAAEAGPLDGEVDRQLFDAIVSSIVDKQEAVDTTIARALSAGWRLERIDAVARAILRAGATELAVRRDVPTAVAIDEYVEIAKAFFSGPEPGFINAALDECAKAIRGDGES
jgi:N utilization substance protein B